MLRLDPDDAPDLLILLVRNGKNRLARQLKGLIADKLFDEDKIRVENANRAKEWFKRQQELISNIEENEEDVSKN